MDEAEATASEVFDLLTALVTLQYTHEHKEAWRYIQDFERLTLEALMFAATAALVDAFKAQEAGTQICLS